MRTGAATSARAGMLALAVVAAWISPAARADEPDAYAEALKAPPAEQRRRIRHLALAGDVRAAARMIDLAMWDEMKDVPVGTPPVDAWLTTPGDFSGMTGAQVLGCVAANWAARHEAELKDAVAARIVEARDRIAGAPLRNPVLRTELAFWLGWCDPKDEARGRALVDAVLPDMESPAQALDPLARATRVEWAANERASATSRLFDLGRAAALAGRAAELYAAAGDRAGEARTLLLQARCVKPGDARGGDWTRAANLFERAAARFAELGDRKGEGESLFEQAWCLEPATNPAGSWSRAAALYERAAARSAEAGDKSGEGDSLHRQAYCLEPDKNPAGSWSRAAALFERAAARRAEAGDESGEGSSLYEQAWCLRPDHDPSGGWPRAIALFERAAARFAAAGDKRGEAGGIYQQAWCLEPDNNPGGDWARAAALYERSAALRAECRDREGRARSLYWLARCRIRGDRSLMTPEVRALFEESARLSREVGDEAGARDAEAWLK